jgi:hypothetical protein
VLDDLLDAAMSVLPRILEQFAEWTIGQPFPDYGRLGRGEAPIRRANVKVTPDASSSYWISAWRKHLARSAPARRMQATRPFRSRSKQRME